MSALTGLRSNLRGQGPTEDKKDNPATRLYVPCQALTPIGLLFESVGFKYVGELSHVNFDKSAELFYVRARLILNAYDEFESNEDKVSAVDLYDEYLLLGLYDTEDVASRYERH